MWFQRLLSGTYGRGGAHNFTALDPALPSEFVLTPWNRLEKLIGLPIRTVTAYAIVFGVVLVLYPFLWPNAPFMSNDSPGYLEVARDLSDLHLTRLHARTPGYPLLLALTGSLQHPTRALFFGSLLLHLASVYLMARILYACGITGIALTSFAVLLTLPPYVEPAAWVLSENLSQFALVVAYAGLASWFVSRKNTPLLISASAFAYAALTRPTYQGIAFTVAAFLLLLPLVLRKAAPSRSELAKAGVAMALASVILIGGYCLTNFVRFRYLGVTPLLGPQLTTKTVRVIERLPNQYAWVRSVLIRHRDAALVKPGSSHTGYTYAFDGVVPDMMKATGMQEHEVSRLLTRINLVLIGKAPLTYVQEVFWAMGSYWLPASRGSANIGLSVVQALWAFIHFVVTALFLLQLVVVGGVTIFDISSHFGSNPRNKDLRIVGLTPLQAAVYGLAATIVVYTMLVSCMMGHGDPRHRVPSDPFIVALMFLGGQVWWQSVKRLQSGIVAAGRDAQQGTC